MEGNFEWIKFTILDVNIKRHFINVTGEHSY